MDVSTGSPTFIQEILLQITSAAMILWNIKIMIYYWTYPTSQKKGIKAKDTNKLVGEYFMSHPYQPPQKPLVLK